MLLNDLVKSILKEKTYSSILIFSSTKEKVRILNRELNQAGLRSKAIHSGLEQEEREEVLRNFKNKNTQILVATDILSNKIFMKI